MSTHTEIPSNEPIIIMTRFYAAPRPLVWRVLTEPEHVRLWWGGAGSANPVCEMDVRPGGLWRHVMRMQNGPELRLEFVFIEVEPPSRLVWQHSDHGQRRDGPPTARMEVTLAELGAETRWTLLTRFESMAARDAALAMGFTAPIEASSELLASYLETLTREYRTSLRPIAASSLIAAATGRPAPARRAEPPAQPERASRPEADNRGRDSLHALAIGSFMPMLHSLSSWLERGVEHTAGGAELPAARLAPDMYNLAQQVQLACHHASDALGRLGGAPPSKAEPAQSDITGMLEQIAATILHLTSVKPATLDGAADRDCSIPIPDGRVIALDGLTFLRAWALPNFYFHIVTAYDILRHLGVPLGKRDYLNQLGGLIRPA